MCQRYRNIYYSENNKAASKHCMCLKLLVTKILHLYLTMHLSLYTIYRNPQMGSGVNASHRNVDIRIAHFLALASGLRSGLQECHLAVRRHVPFPGIFGTAFTGAQLHGRWGLRHLEYRYSSENESETQSGHISGWHLMFNVQGWIRDQNRAGHSLGAALHVHSDLRHGTSWQ